MVIIGHFLIAGLKTLASNFTIDTIFARCIERLIKSFTAKKNKNKLEDLLSSVRVCLWLKSSRGKRNLLRNAKYRVKHKVLNSFFYAHRL